MLRPDVNKDTPTKECYLKIYTLNNPYSRLTEIPKTVHNEMTNGSTRGSICFTTSLLSDEGVDFYKNILFFLEFIDIIGF